jgi:hypothetical protein
VITLPKKPSKPERGPTFLEGILPDSVSATIDKWLPTDAERKYNSSIDDYMFWAMVGSLYYFQWKTQTIYRQRYLDEKAAYDSDISRLLAELETIQNDLDHLKQKWLDIQKQIIEEKDHLKKIREDISTWDQRTWGNWGQYQSFTDEAAFKTYKALQLNNLYASETRSQEVINVLLLHEQEARKDIDAKEMERAKKLFEIDKLKKEKIGVLVPDMDYFTPLFSSMALAYMLKHSEGLGSAAVMGVCLAIIGSPVAAASEDFQDFSDTMNENKWLYALGPGAYLVKKAIDKVSDENEP